MKITGNRDLVTLLVGIASIGIGEMDVTARLRHDAANGVA
jgi:hypothetical protein